jgi:hypothetical protein
MNFDVKKLPIRVGDVFVIARKQEHSYEATSSLDVVNIVFDSGYISTVHPLMEDWMSRDALFAVGPRCKPGEAPGECLHLGSAEYARAMDLVQRMEHEQENAGEEARVRVSQPHSVHGPHRQIRPITAVWHSRGISCHCGK